MHWWYVIPLTVAAANLLAIVFLWRKETRMSDEPQEWQEVKDESRVSVRPRDIFLYGLAGMAAGMMQAGMPLSHAWQYLSREHGNNAPWEELMLEAQTAVKSLSAIIDEHGVSK